MGKRSAACRRAFAGGAIVIACVLAMAGTAAADACGLTSLAACPDAPAVPPATTTTTTAAPTPSTTTVTTSTQAPVEARAQLLELVNDERVRRGLAPLVARADIEDIASRWSESMASAGAISHNDAYFTDGSHERFGARLLGENVARAASVEQAHGALMASEHHRDNILDARFTAIGLGATFRDGSWWITQDFLQPRTGTVTVSAPRARRVPDARPASADVAATPTIVAQAVAAPPAPVAVPGGAGDVVVLPRVDHAPADATAQLAGEVSTAPRPSSAIGAICLLLALAALAARRLLATG